MDGLKKYNALSEIPGQSGGGDNPTPIEPRKPRNIEKESRKEAGRIFNPMLKRLFPKDYPEGKDIREIEEKNPKTSRGEKLDRMGLVLNNEDIKLQDLVYLETDIWRNELSKIYGDKKVDERNKRELEIFEENPYEWVKIALSRKIDRINNKDLSDIEKSSRKKALDNLLDKKRLLIERLNNIKLALDKKIPLEVNGEMRSDWVNLDNGKSLDVEVATDDINKLVGKESLNYSVVGIVIRGKEKYIVVKNEKGERVAERRVAKKDDKVG
jgi:hypothetical protein